MGAGSTPSGSAATISGSLGATCFDLRAGRFLAAGFLSLVAFLAPVLVRLGFLRLAPSALSPSAGVVFVIAHFLPCTWKPRQGATNLPLADRPRSVGITASTPALVQRAQH